MRWLVAAYAGVGTLLALGSTAAINPDAVAYAQVARHFARGDLDLALNTWWSPAYSWLLVPAVWAGLDPLAVGRVLQVAFGLAFASATAGLAGSLAGRPARRAAFAVALVVSVPMVAGDLTPDLALAAAVTALNALWVRYLRTPSAACAAAAGALGGAAFLLKTYALPYAVAATLLAVVAGRVLGTPWRRALGHGVLAVALTAAVAGPWVATISAHAGRVTLGDAARYAATFARMERVPDLGRDKPMYDLAAVPVGRLTTWEAPTAPVPAAPPTTGRAPLLERGLDVLHNVDTAVATLRGLDLAGLAFAAFALAVVWLLVPRSPFARRDRVLLGWTAAAALVFVAGYLPQLVFPRYVWPAVGALVAVVVAAPLRLHDARGHAPTPWALVLAVPAIAALLATALAVGVRDLAFQTLEARPAAQADRALAAAVPAGATVIGTDWARGLRVAYWADAPYPGRSRATSAEALLADLARFAGAVATVPADRADLLDPAAFEVLGRAGDVALVAARDRTPP